MNNVEVSELVLEQEVLQGKCIQSITVVSTSITGRLVTVLHSDEYMGMPVATTFKVVDGEVEQLGNGVEIVEEPFFNKPE